MKRSSVADTGGFAVCFRSKLGVRISRRYLPLNFGRQVSNAEQACARRLSGVPRTLSGARTSCCGPSAAVPPIS